MKRVRGNKVGVVFDHIRFLGSGGNERGRERMKSELWGNIVLGGGES